MSSQILPHDDSSRQVIVYRPSAGVEVALPADYERRTVWATQRQIADALGIDVRSVSYHIQNYREQRGDKAKQGIQEFRIPTAGGYQMVEHYNMTVITYVGFRAQATEQVIAFQEWVGETLDKAIAPPLSPAESLLASVQRLVDHERQLAVHEDRIARLEAETAAINDGVDYFTVKGYCKYMHLPSPTEAQARAMGKRAAKLSRDQNYTIEKSPDSTWGEVGRYHRDILKQVTAEIQR